MRWDWAKSQMRYCHGNHEWESSNWLVGKYLASWKIAETITQRITAGKSHDEAFRVCRRAAHELDGAGSCHVDVWKRMIV